MRTPGGLRGRSVPRWRASRRSGEPVLSRGALARFHVKRPLRRVRPAAGEPAGDCRCASVAHGPWPTELEAGWPDRPTKAGCPWASPIVPLRPASSLRVPSLPADGQRTTSWIGRGAPTDGADAFQLMMRTTPESASPLSRTTLGAARVSGGVEGQDLGHRNRRSEAQAPSGWIVSRGTVARVSDRLRPAGGRPRRAGALTGRARIPSHRPDRSIPRGRGVRAAVP